MSFSDDLIYGVDKLEAADSGWKHFLDDHRAMLLSTAKLILIDPKLMFKNRYRPRRLLEDLRYSGDLEMIVKFINQLPKNSSWVNLTSIYIPNLETVSLLRTQYSSFMVAVGS